MSKRPHIIIFNPDEMRWDTMSHLLHPGEENLFSELRDAGYYVWMNARNDLFAGQMAGWAESNADTIFYG